MSVESHSIDFERIDICDVEKPSGSGLKLDLDRFRREVDDALRHAKKGADEFIENIKPVLAAARAGDDEEGGEQ